MIAGKRDELIGRVQALYGKKKDQAERDVEEWTRELKQPDTAPANQPRAQEKH